ncbi:hypothetical protein NX059_002448 [Plenodomus lindquistii]|nr:hypothetical protein NX059_002448 [Plenodomus lindquistii]
MGSRSSKAVLPYRKAAALPVAAAHPHDKEGEGTNEITGHDDPAPQFPYKLASNDETIATPTTTADMQQCNGAPASSTYANSQHGANMIPGPQISDRNSPTAGLAMMAPPLQTTHDPDARAADEAATPPSPLIAHIPNLPLPEESGLQCLACCKPLPKETDPKYTEEVTRPCDCDNAYCIACVRDMFLKACKDSARMPPRCCAQIHLHQVRRYLTAEEVRTFKLKYEEWSTPSPFYCPIPSCSTFIPARLLPTRSGAHGKRTDSGVGTPSEATFSCPSCRIDICAGCRQTAHPGSLCSLTEFGVDAKTSALLKSWGYKKCPKCGHGLKRMFGCSHMECRCGAHFCWVCLSSRDDCHGDCENDEDEYSDGDNEWSEPDSDDDDDGAQPPSVENHENHDDQQTPQAASGASTPAALLDELPFAVEADRTTAESSTRPTENVRSPNRVRNLDGGSHMYWEAQDLDFGDEPIEIAKDPSWNCEHRFDTYKIKLAEALSNDPSSTEMECTRCWNSIHPEIKVSGRSSKLLKSSMTIPRRHEATGHPIQRPRRRQRRWDVGARETFVERMTAEAASHPPTTASSPLSQSVPARDPSPMEDVQYSDQVVDTYGTIISTTEQNTPRRSSLDNPAAHGTPTSVNNRKSDVFATPPSTFSLAYECRRCALLVCQTCKSACLAAREKEEPVETPAEAAERLVEDMLANDDGSEYGF